jgi:hypothetical protein
MTLAVVEEYGVDRMLRALRRDLEVGSYRPAPVRRVGIPKSGGGSRPLGIPTVRDRVAQQAVKLVLEPIFEADFLSSSFGFRPRRSATDALEKIRVAFPRGQQFVFEADIADFFGSVDHDRLIGLVAERVSGRGVLALLRWWLRAGVLDADEAVVHAVADVAKARGLPMAQVGLAWMLQKDVVTAPIVGATKPGQIEDAVAAVDVVLTDEEIAASESPYVPHPILGHE